MDGGMVCIGELAYVNTDIFIKAILNNYNGLQLAYFSYGFRLNFVANHDVMTCTPQSSKHDLA